MSDRDEEPRDARPGPRTDGSPDARSDASPDDGDGADAAADDPAEDFMRATYCALCEHGYADCSMRDIAARADRSKAALHYHYEDREGLMLAFLDHLYDRFTARVGDLDPDAAADERLRAFCSNVLHPPREDEARDFRTALLEIEAQAPYNEGFRERLERFDEFVARRVEALVREGVESGAFREDADPEAVARFVLVVVNGAKSRHVVAGAPVEETLDALDDYLEARVLAPEVEA